MKSGPMVGTKDILVQRDSDMSSRCKRRQHRYRCSAPEMGSTTWCESFFASPTASRHSPFTVDGHISDLWGRQLS